MDKVPTYTAIHQRLRKQRGPAREHSCAQCGVQANDWALTGEPRWLDTKGHPYSDDLNAYEPLCASCHIHLDRGTLCPHGPERDRDSRGECRECVRARDRERKRKQYAADPETARAKLRERRARQKGI